jgi:hypothetical protein
MLAVFDSRPTPEPLVAVVGRWFTAAELASPKPTYIVREGSYLGEDPFLGSDRLTMPEGETIGTIASDTGRQWELIANLPAVAALGIPDTICITSGDESVASSIVAALADADISVREPEALSSAVTGYAYFPVLVAACLMSLALAATAVADAVRTGSPVLGIRRLVGASRARLALDASVAHLGLALACGILAAGLAGIAGRLVLGGAFGWWHASATTFSLAPAIPVAVSAMAATLVVTRTPVRSV